jgi:hypothetical protein
MVILMVFAGCSQTLMHSAFVLLRPYPILRRKFSFAGIEFHRRYRTQPAIVRAPARAVVKINHALGTCLEAKFGCAVETRMRAFKKLGT